MAKKTKELVNKSELRNWSHYLIWGAVAAVVLSALEFLGMGIWLTATQWLILAGVLAVFGVYARIGA